MVQNSITIKAETIEDAVQTALNILQCSIEDINVQVIKPPSKSLFGLRKRPAEVSITRKEIMVGSINKKYKEVKTSLAINDDVFEELIEEVFDSHIEEEVWEKTKPQMLQESVIEDNELQFGAWIVNNKVFVQENEHRLPIIEADQNVKVLVNGERLLKPQLVTSQDIVKVLLENEVIPCSFWIEIKDNNMMATLSIKKGKKIRRVLEDNTPQEHLIIRAKEIESYFLDIKLEDIMNRLESLNIESGIIFPVINEMLNNAEGEAIIAKGVSPIEGLDGDIEILIEDWNENETDLESIDEQEKIDYREGQSILSVESGQIIAKILSSVPGRPGKDLFNRIVPAKPVFDIAIKTGKNVGQKDNQLVALSAGRPHIESRGKLVKIDVIKEHVHNGDVNLESGNIRFSGDLRILGNVLDSMEVEAEGRVYIMGTINRAVVQSIHSMKIDQNVFSSELSVGKVNHVIATLTLILSELLTYLNHILVAINQILLVRRQKNPKEESIKLSYLIKLLLEKKYGDFSELVNKFYKTIEDNEDGLDEDWKLLADTLKKHFITISKDQNIQIQNLQELVNWMKEMYETNLFPPEPKVAIELPYGINSTLYSSGDINIVGQGVYHCTLRADHNILVKGVCRGGHLSAGNKIILDEVGSENGGKTTILVPSKGKIYINYAHVDTLIQVGRRTHTFKQGTANIAAYLDEEGNLQLYK